MRHAETIDMSTLTVEDLPKFAPKLRARRERMGMTPTDVADKTGIALATYCNIEDARHLPSLPIYQRLCKVLQLSPGKLLE